MFMKDLFPRAMFEADKGGSVAGNGERTDDTKDQDVGGVQDNEGLDTKDKQEDKTETLTKEDVLKMIQSETDRVRTEYSKKLKAKEKELEETKKSQMTEQEKKEYEMKQLQENLSKRERELLEKELTIQTIDLLKTNELPLEAKDFLMGSDKDTTEKNVFAFKTMFNQAVEDIVNQRFKGSGKSHESGDGSSVKYTQEMLSNMTQKEINENWEQIQKDLSQ